jgi:hypothetical protein
MKKFLTIGLIAALMGVIVGCDQKQDSVDVKRSDGSESHHSRSVDQKDDGTVTVQEKHKEVPSDSTKKAEKDSH